MIQIPVLRLGKPYSSLDKVQLVHHVTGEPIAEVSQLSGFGLDKDLSRMGQARKELSKLSSKEIFEKYRAAADHFVHSSLPIGDSEQSFDDYIRCLSSTTGSPMVFCKMNAAKVEYVLRNVEEILAGLTRGLDMSILDKGYSIQNGRMQAFYPCTDAFGAILPSNSPGVHALWIPTLALKTALVLKPGREEPWTPFRVLQAFIKAGLPPTAMSYFPTDHAGAGKILQSCGRSMLFGDSNTTDPYKNDHRVELHGPGFSKVIIGQDQVEHWQKYIDPIVESIAANGGRSCINVSAVWTPKYGKEIAHALAERLAKIEARAWDDPEARLSAFAKPEVAEAISNMVEQGLQTSGATDVTQQIRGTSRLVKKDRCAWILPTIVHCQSYTHPLANKEFLFPYASVVECPQNEILKSIGPTLAAMVLTEDNELIQSMMDSAHIERLNIGPIPTTRLTWDQPHEGNLFTHLYRQRSLQRSLQST